MVGLTAQMRVASAGDSVYRELISVRQVASDAQLLSWYATSGVNQRLRSMFTNPTRRAEPNDTAPAIADAASSARGPCSAAVRAGLAGGGVAQRFPYSIQDMYRHYVGGFNTQRLPRYFAVDLTAFKTVDVFSKAMDLGIQVFNLTNHFNPRDVISVIGSPRFREMTNNPGVTFGGYMQVRW
jgi:hypothetical protein